MKQTSRALSVILSLVFFLSLGFTPQQMIRATEAPTGDKVELIVHYQPAAEDEAYSWKLWIWGEGLPGAVYEFDSEDRFGPMVTLQLPAEWGKIGVIARGDEGSREWAKQTMDLFPTIKDGKAEIWLRGVEKQIYYEEPAAAPAQSPTEVTLKVHYIRYSDQDYELWNIWTWVGDQDGQRIDFTEQDENGPVAVIKHSDAAGIESVGFIMRKSEDGNDWAAKNTSADVIVSNLAEGEQEIWIAENDPTLYFSYDEIPEVILNVSMLDERTAEVKLTSAVTPAEAAQLQVTGAVVEAVELKTSEAVLDNLLLVRFSEAVEPSQDLTFVLEGFGKYELLQRLEWLHSKAFNDLYYFDGELGALYTAQSTTLRLWAPTAERVELIRYEQAGDGSLAPVETRSMTAGEKGTWESVLTGDRHGTIYNYKLYFADGTTTESVDPYARAVTVNGLHSVVFDLAQAEPEGWRAQPNAEAIHNTDAIIYEAHIRDLTIAPDNGIEHKGKFLGLAEPGTATDAGTVSGLDYIKSLGVTHVQLLPIYDFKSVDEAGPLGFGKAYNWGYDPQNYNVPEGSYSTDPSDPAARILELKQMIQTLHNEGLYVIMDVVYNHVFDVTTSPFNLTVPGYYFRYDAKGALYNGTGVGNETASEQPMFRKYMIDSLKYWAQEYDLDGFRFDLMGIHDTETMNLVEQELRSINPGIILLGEGWQMGNHADGVTPSDQYHADRLPGYAFFNDSLRDLLKGSVFDKADRGWISGVKNTELAWDIFSNITGAQTVRNYLNPGQSVVYNEAHDNLTLWDKLLNTNPADSEELLIKRHTLATSIQMLSNGMTFVHAGQEFLRTKGGDHNSYISPDSVNFLDYDRSAEYPEAFAYFKAMLELRKSEPLFRLNNYEEINKAYALAEDPQGDLLHYTISDPASGQLKYIVVLNADTEAKTVTIPQGSYAAIVASGSVETDEAKAPRVDDKTTYEVAPLSASVLMVSKPVAPAPTAADPAATTVPASTSESSAADNANDANNADDANDAGNADDASNAGNNGLRNALIGIGLVTALGLIVSFTQKQRFPFLDEGDNKKPKTKK